ncbi:hypothetical protein F5Y15DRAFT_6651 [Xylariaceae sp. FL0016]|nr:hypothetical protein F5Y15DRAFT_6651 [Xylariaceae sp. FL0016]
MDHPLPTALSSPSAPIAVNSPSDLSYSSGPSHTSTRNTSPDSGAVAPRHSSPRLDLNLKANVEYTPNTLLELQTSTTNMDRATNPFQSVNERRTKLVIDRNTAASQFQQHFIPPQSQAAAAAALRSSAQPLSPGTVASRSLTSSNWRIQPIDELSPQSRSNMYSPFDSPASHGQSLSQQQQTSIRSVPYPSPQTDQQTQQFGSNPAVAAYSTLGTPLITEYQLETSYAYCYQRADGGYTRLIPADMLPELRDVPRHQKTSSGMLVVPQPRALPPSGQPSNMQRVVLRTPPNTPTSPADTIQSRIDNIVASTPPTPTSATHPLSHPAQPQNQGAMALHHHPHHHHAHSSTPIVHHHASQGQRRPKVYCDKWVHEGVCAFTQQGCKYKHEMPFDKVTQHQLGLFHGFPAWWKKHQADLARQRDATVDMSSGGGDRVVGTGSEMGNESGLRSPGLSSTGMGLERDSNTAEEARLGGERYLGRRGAGPSTAIRQELDAAGAGGGSPSTTGGASEVGIICNRITNLGSDGNSQVTWRRSGDYSGSGDMQNLMSAQISRGNAPRVGVAPGVRTPIGMSSDHHITFVAILYHNTYLPISLVDATNAFSRKGQERTI